MKRFLTYCGLAALFVAGSFAAPISPEQALKRFSDDVPHKAKSVLNSGDRLELAATVSTIKGAPATYVFSNNRGFVVLSADDSALPVLGYSDTPLVEGESLPAELQWWLEQYASQIEYGLSRNALLVKPASYDRSWTAIAPQIKSTWDQMSPYNNMCPKSGNISTYTGCVATAMAQVMNYWKYPEIGQGKVSYRTETLQLSLMMNFANQKFDWSNMLDRYEKGSYNSAQADAVAYLMKACGYSVKMNYNTSASGALSSEVGPALVDYFNYDGNIIYRHKAFYSEDEWALMMYENLKNVGPIVYGGQSQLGGGHAFVLDGYDGNGYFHFNWGWSGIGDGYFVLTALNPEALGAGGGAGGFNYEQDAVLGIQPPTGKPVEEHVYSIAQYGSVRGSVQGSTLSFDLFGNSMNAWMNTTTIPMTVKFGAIIESVDGNGATKYITGTKTFSFPASAGIRGNAKPSVTLSGLSNGRYKVTVATNIDKNPTNELVPVVPVYGCANYVYITKNGMSYTVENMEPESLSCTWCDIESDLYMNCAAKVTIKVVNKGDREMTQSFAPVLCSGNSVRFLGDAAFFTLQPGESGEETYSCSFYSTTNSNVTTNTDFYLSVQNVETGEIYQNEVWEKVTMGPNPGSPTLSPLGFTIKDCQMKQESVNNNMLWVYQVDNADEITVQTKLKLTKGYFAYPLYMVLMQQNPDNPAYLQQVVMQSMGEIPFMILGETRAFETVMSVAPCELGDVYFLQAYFVSDILRPATSQIAFKVNSFGSGVEEVAGEEGLILVYNETLRTAYAYSSSSITDIQVFTIDGKNATYDMESIDGGVSIDLSDSQDGIKIVKVTDAEGMIKTLKVF